MGAKTGLNLTEQIAKYVKACRKTHISQTLPQDLSKIDTFGLKLAKPLVDDVAGFSTKAFKIDNVKQELEQAVQASKEAIQKFKDENLFKSSTLTELFSERFTYRGNKPNLTYVKNRSKGEPVLVEIKQEISKYARYSDEVYKFVDVKTNKTLFTKSFKIEYHPKGTRMIAGMMKNHANNELVGLGIRSDQIQIERALQEGISYIPREACSQAIYYHTKMGYLPKADLLEISNYNEALKVMKRLNIPVDKFKPVIVKKDDRYFIDIATTVSIASTHEVKRIAALNHSYKADGCINWAGVDLQLEGDELEHWKSLIRGHEILKEKL